MTSASLTAAPINSQLKRFRGLVDAYDIAHLIRHLDEGGRTAELHKLLAAEHDYNTNFWFTIKDCADDTIGYVDDLRIAWKSAAADINSGADAATGTELLCNYALMLASLRGRDACLPPEFVLRLLQTGIWSWRRTLAYLQAAEDSARRIEATILLLPEVDAAFHEQLFAEAVADLDRLARMYGHFDYPLMRVRNLIRLFRALPEPVPVYAIDALLRELTRQQEPDNVADLIEALVPHATAHHFQLLESYLGKTVGETTGDSYLEISEFFQRRYRRLELITKLCTRRSRPEQKSISHTVLQNVAQLFDNLKKNRMPYVGARLLIRCLRALVEHASEPKYQRIVGDLHAALTANETLDIALSVKMFSFFCPKEKEREAIRFLSRLVSANPLADVMDVVFTDLKEWEDALKSRALEEVLTIPSTPRRLAFLLRFVGILPAPLARTAAAAAIACLRAHSDDVDWYAKSALLAQICPFISRADRKYLFERISAIKTPHWRLDAIAEWLVLCPVEHERIAVFDQALRDARADSEGYNGESLQYRFLRKVAPACSVTQARAALDNAAATNDGKHFLFAIDCILPLLAQEERAAAIQWACGLMRTAHPWDAARSLYSIAEHVDAANIGEVRGFAGSLADEGARAYALAGLLQVSALDDKTFGELWRSVLDNCDLVQNMSERARVYAAIPSDRLDTKRMHVLRELFLATFRNIDHPSSRATALASMESLLPSTQFDTLMLDALDKSIEYSAASFERSVSNVAAMLPARLLDRVWGALRLQDVNDVRYALEAVASRFAQCGMAAQALSVANHLCVKDEAIGSHAIAAIAAALDAADALRLASQVEGFRHHFKDRALGALAIRLAQCDEQSRALQLIKQITDPEEAVLARCGAAMQLGEAVGENLLAPVPVLLSGLTGIMQVVVLHKVVPVLLQHRRRNELLIELLQVIANNRRADLVPALYVLAPVLHATGGEATLSCLMRSIRTVGHWWP